MNLLYSVNSDNDNTSDIFNSLISFQQEENNNISFMDYDSKLDNNNNNSFSENETIYHNTFDIKKDPSLEAIIKADNRDYSNYSDKSTNEEESTKKNFLNKKRKKIFYTKKEQKENKLNKINTPSVEKKTEKRGRKSKDDDKEGKHNKFSGDNIINKIKVYLFYFIRDIINKNSNGEIDLKKIGNKFSADHKVNKNVRQYKMKIRDILMEEEISSKYSTLDNFENRKIIQEIYEKQKHKKVIQILELTFEEILLLFRQKLDIPEDKTSIQLISEKINGLDLLDNNNKYKDIEYFINSLREKYQGKISLNEFDEYISNVKRLCFKYINWFKNKIARP